MTFNEMNNEQLVGSKEKEPFASRDPQMPRFELYEYIADGKPGIYAKLDNGELPSLEVVRSSSEKKEHNDLNTLENNWGEQPPESESHGTNVIGAEGSLLELMDRFAGSLEEADLDAAEQKLADLEKNLHLAEDRLDALANAGYLYDQLGNKLRSRDTINRVYASLKAVLDSKSEFPLDNVFKVNWVASAAAELALPEQYVKQGRHNTCVLRSLANQRMQAGDPAAVIEEAASVVLRGGAFSGAENGIYGRFWSKVNSWSLVPDRESAKFFDPEFEGNRRSLFAQTCDAFAGQVASDLQTRRDRKLGIIPETSSYLYTTANALELGANTRTGEATFLVDSSGTSKYIYDFPRIVSALDQAELNQHMSSEKGAVFTHERLVNSAVVDGKFILSGTRPPGYDNVEVESFRDAEELKAKLSEFQKRTGKPAATMVRAEFLPGDPQGAQGLHSLLFSLKDGQVQLDNSWGQAKDLRGLSNEDIERATNPDVWDANGVKYERRAEKGIQRVSHESGNAAEILNKDKANLHRTEEEKRQDNRAGFLENFKSVSAGSQWHGDEIIRQVAAALDEIESRFSQLESSNHLLSKYEGTADGQLSRIYGALNAVLDYNHGMHEHVRLSVEDRLNWALGAVLELADPIKYVNQGDYFSCAMRSLDKQRLRAGDPAEVIEESASVLIRGGAFVGDENGIYGRNWIKVDASNLIPEGESLTTEGKSDSIANGKRSYFGQVRDALNGQVLADLRTEREQRLGKLASSQRYIFYSDRLELAKNRAGNPVRGQAMYLQDSHGSLRLVSVGRSDPDAGSWDIAELNQYMGGKVGFFADRLLMRKPPGYEKVSAIEFSGAGDFKRKLQEFQSKYGQPAQLAVNLAYLRGEPQEGALMHVLNAEFSKDGSLLFDNNVGVAGDLPQITDEELDKATNPRLWRW